MAPRKLYFCLSFHISGQSAVEGILFGPVFFVTDGGLDLFLREDIDIRTKHGV